MSKNTLLCLLGIALSACQPTPDYRITLRDIPAQTAVLLIGWKSDGDTVGKSSLAVPVNQLDPDQRGTYVIGFDLAGEPDESGVVSVATVDSNLCITSVVSAPSSPRSSSAGVSQIDLELDPNLNPAVVKRATEMKTSPACPPQGMPQIPYPPHVPCAKLTGLSSIPAEPTPIKTRPVVINVLRQLSGQARVFDGGRLSIYGWGFDRATLGFGPACDPTACLPALAMEYAAYMSLISMPVGFSYPGLKLVSYSQLDLPVTEVKSKFTTAPRGLQEGVVLCIAVSAISFGLINSDGSSTSFSEPLP